MKVSTLSVEKGLPLVVLGLAITGSLSNNVQTIFFSIPGRAFSALSNTQFSMLCMFATAFALVAIAVISALNNRFTALLPRFTAISAIVATVLWIATPLTSKSESIAPILEVSTAITVAFLVAASASYWLTMLSSHSKSAVVAVLIVSPCLSAAIGFCLRLVSAPHIRATLAAALSATLALLVLIACKSGGWAPTPNSMKLGRSLRTFFSTGWKAVLFVTILGFASGAIRASSEQQSAFMVSSALSLSMLLGSLLYAAVVRFTKHGFDEQPIRSIVLLVVSTLFFLLPICGNGLWIVLFCIADLIYLASLVYMNHSTIVFALENNLKVVFVLGLYKGLVFLGTALGYLLNKWLTYAVGEGTLSILLLSLVFFYIAAIGITLYLARPNKQDESESKTIIINTSEDAIRTNFTLNNVYRLTDRELDVLIHMLAGYSTPAIAKNLFISENTVKTHQRHLYRKLGVHNKDEAFVLVRSLLN